MNAERGVSLCPLTEECLEHPVCDFGEWLPQHGRSVGNGPMSSIVKGESTTVFEALGLGYEQAGRRSGCVLIVKACHACAL